MWYAVITYVKIGIEYIEKKYSHVTIHNASRTGYRYEALGCAATRTKKRQKETRKKTFHPQTRVGM